MVTYYQILRILKLSNWDAANNCLVAYLSIHSVDFSVILIWLLSLFVCHFLYFESITEYVSAIVLTKSLRIIHQL